MKARVFALLGVLFAASATSAADEDKSIADVLSESKDHTILLTALKEVGLYDTLRAKGTLTLFAPTDAAFKKLDEDTLKRIAADKTLLRKLLTAHVVTGKALTAKNLAAIDGKELNGFRVSVNGGLKVGEAKVTTPDVPCGNGVVHVVDAVLVPGK
jgi:uncharacterized surface protein with fasciclin (FAS1) repeats